MAGIRSTCAERAPAHAQLRYAGAVAAAALMVGAATTATAASPTAKPAPAPALHLPHPFPDGYFEYNAQPGASIADEVIVGNVGNAGGVLRVYASDGVTSPSTGVVYAPREQPYPDGPAGNGEYGAGAWLSLGASELQLGPGQNMSLPFTVRVPAATHPGDWVGSISAEGTVPSKTGSGAVGLNVTQRTTIAVVIHVPGPVDTTSVKIGQPYVTVRAQGQTLNIPLEYDGDVLLKPVMHFRIADSASRVLASFDGQYDTFMPHTTFTYAYLLAAQQLGPGEYQFAGSFGAARSPHPFSYRFRVGPAQVPTPPPTRSGGGAARVAPGWLFPAIVLAPALLALLVLLLLLSRKRCTHCHRWRRRLITVVDGADVAGCAECGALTAHRRRVRLCGNCYRDHVKRGAMTAAGR